MIAKDASRVLFTIFALSTQIVLIANFSVRNWRPELERRYGPIVYALLGVPALLLGALLLGSGLAWYFTAAPFILAAWAAFGYLVDIYRPVQWRSPPRWPIFLAYIGLFLAGQLFCWFSLWYVQPVLWVVYGVLYIISTALNLYSHRRKVPSSGTAR